MQGWNLPINALNFTKLQLCYKANQASSHSPFPFFSAAFKDYDSGFDEEGDEPESNRPIPVTDDFGHSPHRDEGMRQVHETSEQHFQWIDEYLSEKNNINKKRMTTFLSSSCGRCCYNAAGKVSYPVHARSSAIFHLLQPMPRLHVILRHVSSFLSLKIPDPQKMSQNLLLQ